MADTHEADDNEQGVIACCRLADDGFGDPGRRELVRRACRQSSIEWTSDEASHEPGGGRARGGVTGRCL